MVLGQTIYSEEIEEDIDPIAHEKQYLGELKDIRKVADGFDVVMFPIDGRIGNGYTLGGRQFIERFKVGLFVPMHFVVSGFESSWRMKEFTDENEHTLLGNNQGGRNYRNMNIGNQQDCPYSNHCPFFNNLNLRRQAQQHAAPWFYCFSGNGHSCKYSPVNYSYDTCRLSYKVS